MTFAYAQKSVSTLAILLALPLLEGCFTFHEGPLPGEPKNATYTKIEGARIRYMDSEKDETEHKKPPVVLVHGFASSLDVWATVVPTLKTTHRVVSLDLKGFGWSDRPEGDYSPRRRPLRARPSPPHEVQSSCEDSSWKRSGGNPQWSV